MLSWELYVIVGASLVGCNGKKKGKFVSVFVKECLQASK